jgi:hypothetical protein
MKRVTIKQIEARLDHLNKMLGLPTEHCYRDANGKLKWHAGVFIWSSAYGGYKFERVTCDKGGLTNPTGMGYVSKRECLERLNTFILGLDMGGRS